MTAAVIASCAEHYGVLVDEILGRSRRKKVVRARQAAMYVLRKRDDMALLAIQRVMDRDHTTVLYGIRQVDALLPADPRLASLVAMLMSLPKYHRQAMRIRVPTEVQGDLLALAVVEPLTSFIQQAPTRQKNPHPAICTVRRKPKNDLSPDDLDARRRMVGTDKLLGALRRAGYA